MFDKVFEIVLNMSVTASIAAILLIVVRAAVNRRIPAYISYASWSIVLLRLLIPFSFSSILSIFNFVPLTTGTAYISNGINAANVPATLDFLNMHKFDTVNTNLNSTAGLSGTVNVKSAELGSVLSLIWITGVLVLLSISIFNYIKANKMLRTAVIIKDENILTELANTLGIKRKIRIFTSESINTPLVSGILKPRIILPSKLKNLCSNIELRHFITHELVHIKRFDNLIKLISTVLICINWFNPVIWLSYILYQKDMELSCDQKVLALGGKDIRGSYAQTIINLASRQNKTLLNGGVLAFSESNIKKRIKSIVNYKKPRVWAVGMAVVVLAVMGILLLSNPSSNNQQADSNASQVNAPVNTKNDSKPAVAVEKAVSPEEFLKLYNLAVQGEPIKTKIDVPKKWDFILGEYPVGLYWQLANVFSRDAGYDLTALKGKKVDVLIYSLKDGLPGQGEQSIYSYPSTAILLVDSNKVAGAWLSFNRRQIGPSVKKHYLKDITGMDFPEWVDREKIFTYYGKNKDLAKLSPDELLKAYFKAIDEGDKVRAHACQDPQDLLDSLTMNMGDNSLYNPDFTSNNSIVDNIVNVKLLSYKYMDVNDPSISDVKITDKTKQFEASIELKIKWSDEAFNSPGGMQTRFSFLKKYDSGWKISGLGTGP
ncbi:MAG: M56 family metallopeptidase [Bacillota bacterium]|nr:M56 family metallopeptidase [Bacillota bacterium]